MEIIILIFWLLTKKWTVSKFDGSFILTERERIEKDFNQEPRKKTLHKNYEMICISFSEVSIWAPIKTRFILVGENLVSKHSGKKFFFSWSPGLCTSEEGFQPAPLYRNFFRFLGCNLETQRFSSLHQFSIGLREFGEWLSYSIILMCFFVALVLAIAMLEKSSLTHL